MTTAVTAAPEHRSSVTRRRVLRLAERGMLRTPTLAERTRVRREMALLGAAMVYSGELPRRTIRRIARWSNRLVAYYDLVWDHQEMWDDFEIEGRHHLDRALDEQRGVIVAPAHFGRYRWIVGTLLALGARVTLLADEPFTDNMQLTPTNEAWPERFPDVPDWETIAVVSSASPTSLWQLTRALKGGRAVVTFVDGNQGMHGYRYERSSIDLSFLGFSIGVRTGIAALAWASGSPIVPVVTRDRPHDRPLMRVDPPLVPAAGEPRTAFYRRSMGALFSWLDHEVRTAPHEWEEWATLPHWMKPRELRPLARAATFQAPLGLPALAGRRLRLRDPQVWTVHLRERPEVIDLASWCSLGDDSTVIALIAAAETQRSALDWVRGHADPVSAFEVLALLTKIGIVELVDTARH